MPCNSTWDTAADTPSRANGIADPLLSYEIRQWIDVLTARRAVQSLASEVGFPRRECAELAIVTSELGSNILKYGVHGSIRAAPLTGLTPGTGLVVTARDFGPQFHDLAIALKDGCDDRGPLDPMQLLTRKGIGGGLGAVLRLTHSFSVHPLADGKEITVQRHLKQPAKRAP